MITAMELLGKVETILNTYDSEEKLFTLKVCESDIPSLTVETNERFEYIVKFNISYHAQKVSYHRAQSMINKLALFLFNCYDITKAYKFEQLFNVFPDIYDFEQCVDCGLVDLLYRDLPKRYLLSVASNDPILDVTKIKGQENKFLVTFDLKQYMKNDPIGKYKIYIDVLYRLTFIDMFIA